jgi:[ribosomal protein S18]-alanine N-acetyltransferase
MSLSITPVPLGAEVPLAEMHRACFPEGPWDAATLERILALAGGFGYLAWRAESPVGFILARDLAGEVEILSVGVLPPWRRRGVGRALMDAVVAKAERDGLGSIVLEVASENAAARRLYAAFGFVQVGRRPGYYRQPEGRVDGLILRRGMTSEPASR